MDLTFTESETAFRDELRAWFAANLPGDEPAGEDASYAWRRDFQRRLAADGLAAIPDLAGAAADHLARAERQIPPLDEKPTDEDQQPPEVVLVEGADVLDEPAVEAHGAAGRRPTTSSRPRWRPPGRSAPR